MNSSFIAIHSPGNRPDRWEFGCVPYVYEIARCQLTNAEWCEFLNAQGEETSKRLKLFHKDMATGVLGGIEIDAAGHFRAKDGWAKKPVVYVNFKSVCRYCNWLSSGKTECGSYDMLQEVPRRVVGARYFIPNENEWYKAAYWRNGVYVDYPTGNSLPSLDQANFERDDEFAVGAPSYFADVDAFASAATPDGVVQMGGNAWELLEDVAVDDRGRLQNHYRGGSFGYTETGLSRRNCDSAPYNGRCYVFGVRIARKLDGWKPMPLPLGYRLVLWGKRMIRKCRKALSSRLRR